MSGAMAGREGGFPTHPCPVKKKASVMTFEPRAVAEATEAALLGYTRGKDVHKNRRERVKVGVFREGEERKNIYPTCIKVRAGGVSRRKSSSARVSSCSRAVLCNILNRRVCAACETRENISGGGGGGKILLSR